tara:strand:+ start:290 stop:511 length:222 start_codon:yes stop_codon:yes gene_type:complete
MPDNNYNYGASYIMGADKTKVTEHPETNLTREKKDFTPNIDNPNATLIQAYPKKQSKPTVQSSMWSMANQKDY